MPVLWYPQMRAHVEIVDTLIWNQSENVLHTNADWISLSHCIYCCLRNCGHGWYVRVASVNGYERIYYRVV